MGTVFTFQVGGSVDASQTSKDLDIAFSILTDADDRFSLYKAESEISKISRGELTWEECSPVQREIREQAQNWKEITSGHFDPQTPQGSYDPSGLVKTWAARNAAMYLEASGYRDFTLNAGGDVYIGPEIVTFPLSRVGLSNLKPINSPGASVNMILDTAGTGYRGVATSGSTERGEHIWRSSDSEKSNQFLQATVVATDLITADIWATALISGGKEAFEIFESKIPKEQAVAVATGYDGRIHSSAGFSSILANLG
jgi:thiamine biosynthesis lipoprotein